MANRSGLIVGLVVGVAAGAVVAVALMGGHKPAIEPQAQAADPVPPPNRPLPRTLAQELTPLRKTAEAEIVGGRDITALGTEYFVRFHTERLGSCRLTADSAVSLLRFYRKTKDLKPARIREVEASALTWACEPYYPLGFRPVRSEGVHYEMSRLIAEGENFVFWVWLDTGESGSVTFTNVFFDALAETLKDLDRLKAVKPTIEP